MASGPHPLCAWAARADQILKDLAVRIAAELKIPLEGMRAEKVGTTETAVIQGKVPGIHLYFLNNQPTQLLHTIDAQLSKIDVDA